MNQVSFFDLNYGNPPAPVEPLLDIGQTVYMVRLGEVFKCAVNSRWKCTHEEPNYYGYHLYHNGRGYDSVWDVDVGESIYLRESEARRIAGLCEAEKYNLQSCNLEALQIYGYVRGVDQYHLFAAVAKIGNTSLYEHDYYCYRFVREYKTQKERDKAYTALLCKIQKESTGEIESQENYKWKPLYKVTDELWASVEYAELHRIGG